MLWIATRVPAEAATVAARRGEQKHVNAVTRVFGERASHAQRFIVGMSEHGH